MPLLLKQLNPLRGVWKIEESPDSLLALLEKKENYLPFLESVRTERRKQEWLAVRVLLKELLGIETTIAYRENGSPYLPDSSLSVSISHTNGFAAVLLQEGDYAGIDIEYYSDRVLKLYNRFLNIEEISSIDKDNELNYLLVCWTAKECLFKMLGEENVDFRTQLHVLPFSYKEEGILTVKETRTAEQRTFSLHYQVTPDFIWVFNND